MNKMIISGELTINGIGGAAGGRYSRVDINGVGTLNGDIEADTFRSNGHLKARGSIVANRLQSDGTMRIDGSLRTEHGRVNGTVKVKESVTGELLEMHGILTIADDCELEHLKLHGVFTIGGLLNAGRLDLDIFARCQAREIGGEIIRVRKTSGGKWKNLWKRLIPAFVPELHVSVVEGDDIELEATTASIVRGKRIIIGKGCSIGRVEYSEQLQVLPGAKVGEEININGNSSFA
ncbi:hypothetical protein [Paenibacillus sp. HJGM_3]|uniref:hypothetical protein n=1 Tax=Paenibacillus sp. HJGM_3 TaxID=3379816 RepID=UPI00385DBD05